MYIDIAVLLISGPAKIVEQGIRSFQLMFFRVYDATNFNDDAQLDLVVSNGLNNNVSIFLGCDNGSFMNQMRCVTGNTPLSVAVGDFNNDTTLDIIVANFITSCVGVPLGHGNETFANVNQFPIDDRSNPFALVVGDFNNDKKLDFAVANDGTDNLRIFLQTC